MADKPSKPKEMPLDGRLVTSVDPVMIGPNFQELKNMRYFDTNPRAIKGMSKINTTALPGYPKISNGYHFKKEQPAESHVLVQGVNAGETESKVFENTTAIPNTGDFSATALHTDSGTGQGRFSEAPNGNVAYCNGAESLAWGGDEHFISGFVVKNPDGDWSKDYTSQVQNTLTDSANVATLTKVSGDLPTNTKVLLHLDNNVTDSSAAPHTVTNNNVTFTTSSKFGTHAAKFNGTTAYLTIPDHADFDFSAGKFTVDGMFKTTSGSQGTIFSQATDANNYMRLFHGLFGTLQLQVVAGGVSVVDTGLDLRYIPNLFTGNYNHIEFTESGDDWYIFIDGKLVAYVEDTSRMADYTGLLHIGVFYNGSTYSNYYEGDMDELRIGSSALHTSYFDPREVPYGTAAAYAYVGAVRPMKSMNLTIGTANTTASSVKGMEWLHYEPSGYTKLTQGMWVDLSTLVDNTASGGVSLAQNGTITFDDTKDTANTTYTNSSYFYWYKFVFTDIDDTTTISQITLDMTIQTIKDLWDGELRSPVYFEVNTGSVAFDNTINVFEGTYTSTNSATFSDLSALPAGGGLVMGFTERITAVDLRFISAKGNTNNIYLQGLYWNGTAYQALMIDNDGTYNDGKALSQSGVISWSPPPLDGEEKQEINGRPPLYYYILSIALPGNPVSANCNLYYVGGVTTQRQIDGYKFPIMSHNRLMLGSNQDDKKNSMLIGAPNTTSIFNGVDAREISFGNDDDLVAGSEVFGQFGSDIYNLTLVCKKSESWLLSEQESSFEWFRVSSTIGCTAPLAMTSIHTPAMEERPALNGVIFQSTDAIYLFDGREFHPIHRDIEDVFTRINKTYLDKSVGFFDETNQEWHWLITTGVSTTHNEEWVLDLKRNKWYQIDRTSYLQSGFKVEDTVGNFYTYGTLDTGFMERLENGTTFDGTDMTFTLWTADMPLSGSSIYETRIRHLNLLMKAKNTTTNSVAVTHYGDGATTGKALQSFSPANTASRISTRTKSINTGQHVFHSIKLEMTTNNEEIGFEPMSLGAFYQDTGEHNGIENN